MRSLCDPKLGNLPDISNGQSGRRLIGPRLLAVWHVEPRKQSLHIARCSALIAMLLRSSLEQRWHTELLGTQADNCSNSTECIRNNTPSNTKQRHKVMLKTGAHLPTLEIFRRIIGRKIQVKALFQHTCSRVQPWNVGVFHGFKNPLGTCNQICGSWKAYCFPKLC